MNNQNEVIIRRSLVTDCDRLVSTLRHSIALVQSCRERAYTGLLVDVPPLVDDAVKLTSALRVVLDAAREHLARPLEISAVRRVGSIAPAVAGTP